VRKKPRVLFLSAGNSKRSQMAEGFLRSMAGERFEVASAGIESKAGVNPLAVEVMAEAGIDISHQHSKNVAESIKEHFAYVITLCDSARERSPVFPFTVNLLHWNLIDPSLAEVPPEEILRSFRHVREEIKARVQKFLAEVAEREGRLAGAQATSNLIQR
jgi:arsenate reductase (thioredoxin)